MEVMQCGLNWNMMMQKREIFKTCFKDFDYGKIAGYGEADIERIGSITVYSHLQACGLIQDHMETCFRYHELAEKYPVIRKRRDKED